MGPCDTAEGQVYDVVVVGAGPAGAPAACYLKLFDTRSLLRVLLIEKHEDPAEYDKYHHKCGEGVSDGFFEEIAPIRIEPSDITTYVDTVREYWGMKHATEDPFKLHILDRPSFLRHVIEAYIGAGGEVRWDQVLEVDASENLVRLSCKSGFVALARVVIGADGPNSRVRTTMGFPEPKIITLMQYLVPDEPGDEHTITFWYGGKYDGGYKYKFPYGPGKAKLGFIKGTAEYHGQSYEIQAKQMALGGMPTFAKDRVVLIGAAGAFTNPLTCAGIRVGFVAGRMLAGSIVKAVEGQSGDGLESRLDDAIHRFEAMWKRSPYYAGKYMKAYERFKDMDDAAIEAFAEPYVQKGRLRGALLFLKNAAFWPMYKAFWDSARYSV
ncbi:MAG: NAD(P)/FAD-dependent oxidoreductase [Candidatus Lokiarchaeota archaeon]|nr:NAD(P)/FAD-dependent oxidoreductase [Candidatus Lokiarchaeota archaeon]